MYKFLWAAVFLLAASLAKAQNTFPADSLLKAADTEIADTAKMKIYNKLANYYMDNNAGKAIEYLQKAKAIAHKENLLLKEANNFYSIGYCYLIKADYEKSLYHYQQSVKGYEKLKDSFRLSNALMSIGNVYFQNEDIGKTNEYYNKAEILVRAMNDSSQLTSIYDSRGTHYDKQKKFDTAILYLNKAYAIALSIKDTGFAMNTLSNIGLTLKHQFKTKEALATFNTILNYYTKSQAPNDVLAIVYNNIAATHAQDGNYGKAQEAFDKSIAFSVMAGSPTIEMENYKNMSDMYSNMNNYKLQAAYLKKYHHLKDSIFSLDNKNQLTQLEADYQVGKKNIEIVQQEAELVKQKNQRNLFIILAIAAAVLLAALAFFYKRIKNNNALLTQKNIQINEQKNELQTLNQVKDRLFSIISHDLRNPLATLRSYLSLADDDSLVPEKKLQFKLQTMNAVLNTGDMLDNLLAWANVQIKNTPVAIIPINITDCVWDTVHSVQAQALQKKITINQDIAATTALGDYDILSIALRNLVTNAIKFSDTHKNIFIQSIKEKDEVSIVVRDEGMGMTDAQVSAILSNQNNSTQGTQGEKGSGLGLFLVRELLQRINAQLLITSKPGKGSSFTIILLAL